LVQQYQKSGLAATILQPTIVYGPWAFWSTHAAALMARGVLALPENGMGLCNAVYVDDVLDAVFLALQSEKVLHGPYLISGYEPVTWRDYFLAHADGHGSERVGNMTEQEKASKSRQFLTAISLRTLLPPQLRYHLKGFIRELPGLKRLHNRSPWMQSAFRVLKGLLGFGVAMNAQPSGDAELQDKPRVLPNPDHLPLLVSRTLVQIELAKSELGYKSRFNLAQGATLTSEWLRWSGLHSE
jgi:nucleoside-diphosphate-sugar epimerase